MQVRPRKTVQQWSQGLLIAMIVVLGSLLIAPITLAEQPDGSDQALTQVVDRDSQQAQAYSALDTMTYEDSLEPLEQKETVGGLAASDYGSAIVGFALSYVGYPYVWAGNGPYGFDCSGFTEFVMLNVLGIDIGHALQGQPGMGAWVNYGEWQPGDIIFFQNTYKAGLSHAAIYIGNGQIVHAENESTGVTIDSLYSSYYGPRYWGAIRVG